MIETSQSPEAQNPTVQADPDSGEFVEVTELLHADAGEVTAKRVSIEQSTAGTIHADQVEIEQSAIKSVNARETRMQQSATAYLKSDDTALHDSAAGIVTANRIDLFDSTVGILRGPVTVGEGSRPRIFLHVGGGNGVARPMLNSQSALTLGASAGLAVVIVGRVLRRILGD